MELDEATQSIAEQLGRAVVVFDTELNVIAFSVHDGDVDRGRLAIILNRKATPHAAEMIAQSKAKNSREPVVLPPYDDVNARVLMPLRHQERLYGFLSFSETHHIDGDALHAYSDRLAQASSTLGALLALRELEKRDTVNTSRELLKDLLGPVELARTRAAASLVSGGLLAKDDRYATVLIRHRHPDSDASALRLLLGGVLREVLRSSMFTAFGSLIDSFAVAIIPGSADEAQVDAILRRHSEASLVAGIGGESESLDGVVDSFRQARIASLGALHSRDGRLVACWDRMGLDRLLLQLPLEDLHRDDLPVGVTQLLRTESGIDLARTLDAYLSCGGEAQETARQLHIHRSTLYYRLDKIREITGLELADGDVRRELHTGLRVAELAGFWSR